MQTLKLLNIANPSSVPLEGFKGIDGEPGLDGSLDKINFDLILDSFRENNEEEISDLVKLMDESVTDNTKEGFSIIEGSGNVIDQELITKNFEEKEILNDLVQIINSKVDNFSSNPVVKLDSKDAIPKEFFSKLGMSKDLIFKSENGKIYEIIGQNEKNIQLKVIKGFNKDQKLETIKEQNIQNYFKNNNSHNIGNENKIKKVSRIDNNKIKFEAAEDVIQAKKNIKIPANRLEIINGYKDKNYFPENEINKKQIDAKNLNIDKQPSKVPYFNELNTKVNQSEVKMSNNHEINKQNNEFKSISGSKIFNNELRSMPEVNKTSNESGDFNLDNLIQDDVNIDTKENAPKLTNIRINPTSKPLGIIDSSNFIEINGNGTIEETISRVNSYIQSHYNKTDENLNITVKHESLGKFQLAIKENTEQGLEIKILTGTEDGNKFFVKNENEISNNLKNLGLKIGDVKVISSPEIFAEQKDFNDSNKDNSSQDLKNNKSDESKERKEDSQRRQNLWEFYRERMLS